MYSFGENPQVPELLFLDDFEDQRREIRSVNSMWDSQNPE